MGLLDKIKGTTQAATQQAPATAQATPRPAMQQRQAPKQAAANPYAGMSETELKRPGRLPMGQHVLKVIQCRDGYLPAHAGGDWFFGVDFEIVESTDPLAVIGSDRSWLTTLGKFPQYFHRNVKGFLAAVLGGDATAITDDSASEAASEANPLAGQFVIADVTPDRKSDPKTGEPYTRVTFLAVPADNKAA